MLKLLEEKVKVAPRPLSFPNPRQMAGSNVTECRQRQKIDSARQGSRSTNSIHACYEIVILGVSHQKDIYKSHS